MYSHLTYVVGGINIKPKISSAMKFTRFYEQRGNKKRVLQVKE